MMQSCGSYLFFFFNDTATTEIYPLSLHDALPISAPALVVRRAGGRARVSVPALLQGRQREELLGQGDPPAGIGGRAGVPRRSEEHTSELQSRQYLVCRLLLEKKKNSNLLIRCYMT